MGTHISRRALMAGAAGLAGCGRKATGYPGYAFVANQDGRSVTAVDLNRFAVARQIRLDSGPTEVIAHPSRAAVYVLLPEHGTVCEIEVSSLAVRRRARLCQSALAMRLAADGASLWVLSREPRALIRVPLDSFRPAAHLFLPHEPRDFEVHAEPGGHMAGVSFPSEEAVALCDLQAGTVMATVAAGAQPRIAGFRKDGKHLLIGNGPARVMTILEAATGKVIVRLPLPLEPAHFCFLQDGGQLFVTGPGMDAVVIVLPFSTEVGETILAGRAPANMAVLGAPAYLFVSNPESGDVTILDIDTRKLVVVVHAGIQPRRVVFTPDNQYALVLNSGSGDMTVIRIGEFTTGPQADWARRYKHGALFALVPVGAKPVGAAVVRALSA